MIKHEEIQEALGLKQTGAMKRALKKAGLPFKEVNGRLLAMNDAWTAAQVGRAKKKKGPNFEALARQG